MKRTFQPSRRKGEISTDSGREWQQPMVEKFLPIEGQKVEKKISVSSEPRHKK